MAWFLPIEFMILHLRESSSSTCFDIAFCFLEYPRAAANQGGKQSGLAIQVLSDYPGAFQIAQNNIIKCGNLIKGMEETIKYMATVEKTVNSKYIC